MRGLKIANPYGAFAYDVAVIFCGRRCTVEVQANTMTEAAALAERKGFKIEWSAA